MGAGRTRVEDVEEMKGERLAAFVEATRPWSFTMTAISVTLGSLLALQAGTLQPVLFVLVLLGMIAVHAATNLLNDYYDHKHGVDRPGSATAQYRRHPILSGLFTPRQVLTGSVALYAVGGVLAVVLTLWRGWFVAVLAGLGLLASVFYTGGPVRYKHRGLGELSVFFMWGPLMVGGAYYVQVAAFHRLAPVMAVAVLQGLWVALVIFANNLKDIELDGQTGVRTVAAFLGRRKALSLYALVLGLIYLLCVLEIAVGLIPVWGLLVLLSAPLAVRLVLRLKAAGEIPADADPRTARTGMLFGLLLLAAYLIAALVPAA
jgi:1,4-dihydroxy-2-naphthoate octaprenyltransferase